MEDGPAYDGTNKFNSSKTISQVSSVKASGAKSDLTPKRLSKVFDISLEDAIETLRRT